MPLSFPWIQVLTNLFLQFFKLDWLRPIVKAFDFPGWVNKHEPFGMKLLVDGLPEKPLQNAAFKIKTGVWLTLTRTRAKRFVTTFRDPFARNMSAFFEQSWKLGVKVEDMVVV